MTTLAAATLQPWLPATLSSTASVAADEKWSQKLLAPLFAFPLLFSFFPFFFFSFFLFFSSFLGGFVVNKVAQRTQTFWGQRGDTEIDRQTDRQEEGTVRQQGRP